MTFLVGPDELKSRKLISSMKPPAVPEDPWIPELVHRFEQAAMPIERVGIFHTVCKLRTSSDPLANMVDDGVHRGVGKAKDEYLWVSEGPKDPDRVRPARVIALRHDLHDVPAVRVDVLDDL